MIAPTGKSRSFAIGRRGFLKLIAAGGVTAAGAYVIGEYAPWLDYDQTADESRTPLNRNSDMPVDFLELVRYATLAASSHNSQPWKFAVLENGIEIHPDYSRRLPVVDPQDRSLWISVGCALENLLVAARAAGYATEVTYPDPEDFIRVRLAASTAQDSPLFAAIPVRQNTRSEYDGRAVENGSLDQMQALALEPGVTLKTITTRTGLDAIQEFVRQGTLFQYGDRAFLDELIRWLRFNKKEALASRDGLYTRCTGNPEVPRWLGGLFVSGTRPEQQADGDSGKLGSSSGAIVIATDTDDRKAWVLAGQVYERLALTMTSLNLKSAFLNPPIEAAVVRGQFQSAMGLGYNLPQLLARFGYANPMPRSLRQPVEKVLL
ncbi:MAG: twin-arginine translocation signal domain-containing protein [Anaerolineales bacterium]